MSRALWLMSVFQARREAVGGGSQSRLTEAEREPYLKNNLKPRKAGVWLKQ
jgi:hypothetical protein